MKSTVDDRGGMGIDPEPGDVGSRHPADVHGIVTRLEHATERSAQEIDDDEVIPNPPALVTMDPIEDLDDGAHLDVDPGLLAHLAAYAVFE